MDASKEKKKLPTERISKAYGCAKPIYVSETVILVVFFLFVIFIPFRFIHREDAME